MKKRILFLLFLCLTISCISYSNVSERPVWEIETVVYVDDSFIENFNSEADAFNFVDDILERASVRFIQEDRFDGEIRFCRTFTNVYTDGNGAQKLSAKHKEDTILLVFSNYEYESSYMIYTHLNSALIPYNLNKGKFYYENSSSTTGELVFTLSQLLGAVNTYSTRVEKAQNPFNNEEYIPEMSIMNGNYSSKVWDQGNIEIINRLEGHVPHHLANLKFIPSSYRIEVVDADGDRVENVLINQYLIDFDYWNSWKAIVSDDPVLSGVTDENGVFEYRGNYYIVDDPVYGIGIKYSNILISIDDGKEIATRWLPLDKAIESFLQGNETYTLRVRM